MEGSNDIPITPESVTNGKLILKDITQETEGKYKCEASNIKGSTSQEFPIDVMSKFWDRPLRGFAHLNHNHFMVQLILKVSSTFILPSP